MTTLQYTTVENIARRLRGRLEIENQPPVAIALGQSVNYGSTIGGQVVDPYLLEQIGFQKEAYINLILSQIYALPLSLTHPITKQIMAEITECLVISAVLKVHYQGSLAGTGSDAQGLGVDLDRQAYMLLASLTIGHNIYIPMVTNPPMQQTYPGTMPPQPLVLPGEQLLYKDQPDTIHRVYNVIGYRKDYVLDTVDWWGPNSTDRYYTNGRLSANERARGAERPFT